MNFLRHRHLEPAVRTCRETRRDTTGNCISVDISDGRFEGERTRKFPGFILQNYRRPKQTTPRIGYRIIAGTRIITIDSFCDFYDRRNRLRTDIAKRTVGAWTLAEFLRPEKRVNVGYHTGGQNGPERPSTRGDQRLNGRYPKPVLHLRNVLFTGVFGDRFAPQMRFSIVRCSRICFSRKPPDNNRTRAH